MNVPRKPLLLGILTSLVLFDGSMWLVALLVEGRIAVAVLAVVAWVVALVAGVGVGEAMGRRLKP